MAVNEADLALKNWISASISDHDKALLNRLTELDGYETGAAGNQSATIRRLIRQEAKRRKVTVTIEPATN